jgi:serine/threonine protein kinase
MSRKMFNVLVPIGKGGFGKVWKVEAKKNKQIFAMKQMSKVKVINKKSVSSVMNEKEFLCKLNHPFLVNMTSAFQDREYLYLIMDYLDGGDLRYHLGNKRYFNEKETKFFVANILIGLEYMHKNKIIHRDIKPENLVLDSQGYLRITDLGISREFRQNNSQDTSGTPGYMAPEVMCRK